VTKTDSDLKYLEQYPMTDVRPKTLSQKVAGYDIEYLDYPSEGPPLVLLHATGFLPWMWHPIARELCRDFHVIAPYFCDHRHAEPDEGGLAWTILAEDLAQFVKALGLERPFMVGHSMGATVITLAEAAHGPLFGGMALIEPIYLPEPFYGMDIGVDQHPLAGKARRRKNQWQGRDKAREYLLSKALFKNFDDEMLDLYMEYGMRPGESGELTLVCHPERESSLFMGSLARNPWPLLDNVECPVLVIEGGESENRQYIDLKKATSLFPSGEYIEVAGAGHLVPMEKPAKTIEVLSEFFKR